MLINDLFDAIFYYDRDLHKHSVHVGKLASWVAKEMKYSDTIQQELQSAGMLHDYGKLCIPKTVLDAERSLTDAERELVRQHPIISFVCIKGVIKNADILRGIYEHHERIDGSGYPDGLKDVSIFGQIVGLCDSFDAICSIRVYKEAQTVRTALEILSKDTKKGMFDEQVMQALTSVVYNVEYREYLSTIYSY